VKEVAIAGGVSANSGLRNAMQKNVEKLGWNVYIPKFEYNRQCRDDCNGSKTKIRTWRIYRFKNQRNCEI
jgi:hypothetical protein